ncbi:unnamed protein product [Tuber aestivum]|uniref:Uncharacterized protein n=1 Tax=Tuber aestivum TaxID=59557 RepID=A0A292QAH2_9PEZI|nr:unnamed protein product [Tuber aestivum]
MSGRNTLIIQPSKEAPGTIHLLPCHVKYTGSANATKHWVVNAGEVDGTKVAHFRGRRLIGKGVSLPEGYSGLLASGFDWMDRIEGKGLIMDWGVGHVLTVTDEAPTDVIERSKRNRPVEEEEGEGEGEEEKGEVRIFKGLANFDHVVVWGHDIAPEEEYVIKGMDEWIGLASKIHGFEDEDEESK